MRSVLLGACLLAMTTACATDVDLDTESFEQPFVEEAAEVGVYPAEPTEKIYHGDAVNGAGDNGQWEGIVHLEVRDSAPNWCTGFFITDRHVLTSGHCFESQGTHTVRFRAPTWNNNAWNQSTVWVNRQGTGRSIDVAVVQFTSPVAWANSSRRFRLFTGSTVTRTMLDIYGYGARNHDGNSGVLRRGEGGSRVRLLDHDDGWFKADAYDARICLGDSGGPAIREGNFAIVWGIAHSIVRDGNNECAAPEEDMTWTKINHNMAYIEDALGFSCARFTGDDQNYARCW
jgi:V8-like Glu-specific endopeptidase